MKELASSRMWLWRRQGGGELVREIGKERRDDVRQLRGVDARESAGELQVQLVELVHR